MIFPTENKYGHLSFPLSSGFQTYFSSLSSRNREEDFQCRRGAAVLSRICPSPDLTQRG